MTNGQSRQLFDPESGLVDRACFSDLGIYEQELERIFARCWLYVGHESQVPNPGDFLTAYMGEDPVILWRDADGVIHAFLNMCRHRGNPVCKADSGNARAFMCTYHGWTYDSTGSLITVPGMQQYYFNDLDTSRWGLVEVAQLDTYKGLIFATFDASAPPLLDYLAGAGWDLDMLLDRRAGGTEIIGGVHRWTLDANWKFGADNFGGDDGHHTITHASVRRVPVDDRYYSTNNEEPMAPDALLAALPRGLIRDYYLEHLGEAEERLGLARSRSTLMVTNIFPNCSVNFTRNTVRVWQPRGPNQTEIWSYCIVEKDAPQEVKDALLLHYIQTFGPSGNVEQDDMNNWAGCTTTARGWVARQYPMNIQAGLGHDIESPSGGTRLRGFYQQWANLMNAERWADAPVHPMPSFLRATGQVTTR